jgi:hypothetical protein
VTSETADASRMVRHAYTRRESMFCRFCCGSLRLRRIAEVLVSLYGRVALR